MPPSATEVDLMNAFSGCGTVDSVKVMKDGKGKSRQFGYINYVREDDAERAARFGTLVLIQGRSIQVKGPKELEKEGHYKRKAAAPSAGKDYRPLTDCLFFMEKGGCKSVDKVQPHSVCGRGVHVWWLVVQPWPGQRRLVCVMGGVCVQPCCRGWAASVRSHVCWV